MNYLSKVTVDDYKYFFIKTKYNHNSKQMKLRRYFLIKKFDAWNAWRHGGLELKYSHFEKEKFYFEHVTNELQQT